MNLRLGSAALDDNEEEKKTDKPPEEVSKPALMLQAKQIVPASKPQLQINPSSQPSAHNVQAAYP